METSLFNTLHVQVDMTFTCTSVSACKVVEDLAYMHDLVYVDKHVGRTVVYTIYSVSLEQHADILRYLKHNEII